MHNHHQCIPRSFRGMSLLKLCMYIAFVSTALGRKGRALLAPRDRPWLNSRLPIPERTKLLMDQMTLTERARQTYAVHNLPQFVGKFRKTLGETGFGSLKLSSVPVNTAADQVRTRNELQAFVMNTSRLNIPLSWHSEVLLSACPEGTNFPLPVTLGASFNATLVEQVHRAIAIEARATGTDVGYAPEVNMYVDPRFGRLQEGFSEDPFLTTALGVAAVRGLQQDGGTGPGTPLPTGVAALAKHFVAYGSAAGGQNVGRTDVSERTLREVFLKPWTGMIKAGLRALMPSHQTVFGVPVHGNAWVGQTLLRAEHNWTLGLSVSDCSDVGVLIDWGLAKDSAHAAAMGLEAGVDMDNMCGKNADDTWTYQHVEEAVSRGLLSEKRVNESASRVLSQKFSAGLFEHPFTDTTAFERVINSPEHQQLALEAAQQGSVLLLNRNDTLPMRWEGKTVALIGETASCNFTPGVMATQGTPGAVPGDLCPAQLNMLGKIQHRIGNIPVVTLHEAMAKSNLSFTLGVARGAAIDGPTDTKEMDEAVALAAKSDVAVLVLGDSPHSCGEWGDRDSLSLPGSQPLLLQRVLETGVPVVLVLVNGRPATFDAPNITGTDMLGYDNLKALIVAWRPGQAGGSALWNILTGEAAPTGKLPQSWLRNVGQVGGPSSPWYHPRNGKWISNHKGPIDPVDGLYHSDPYVDHPSTPLFAFGAGMTYTTFRYGNPKSERSGEVVTVSVTVTNEGDRDGVETVLVFVTVPLDTIVRDWKRLVGVRKVVIQKGEAMTVAVDVPLDELKVLVPDVPGAPQAGAPSLLQGSYTFTVGGSAATAVLSSTVVL